MTPYTPQEGSTLFDWTGVAYLRASTGLCTESVDPSWDVYGDALTVTQKP